MYTMYTTILGRLGSEVGAHSVLGEASAGCCIVAAGTGVSCTVVVVVKMSAADGRDVGDSCAF